MEIGAKIKLFADMKKWSLSELSRQLGMNSRQQLYDYVNGKSIPGGELLAKFHQLGCDINWLLSDEKNNLVCEAESNYSTETPASEIELLQEIKNLIKINIGQLTERIENLENTIKPAGIENKKEDEPPNNIYGATYIMGRMAPENFIDKNTIIRVQGEKKPVKKE